MIRKTNYMFLELSVKYVIERKFKSISFEGYFDTQCSKANFFLISKNFCYFDSL